MFAEMFICHRLTQYTENSSIAFELLTISTVNADLSHKESQIAWIFYSTLKYLCMEVTEISCIQQKQQGHVKKGNSCSFGLSLPITYATYHYPGSQVKGQSRQSCKLLQYRPFPPICLQTEKKRNHVKSNHCYFSHLIFLDLLTSHCVFSDLTYFKQNLQKNREGNELQGLGQ